MIAFNEINLKAKHVYGNKLYYSNCETAQKFLVLLQKKTFGENDIARIKALGYEVKITGEE